MSHEPWVSELEKLIRRTMGDAAADECHRALNAPPAVMFTEWQIQQREEIYELGIFGNRENDPYMPKIYTSVKLFRRYPLGGMKQLYRRFLKRTNGGSKR